MNLSVMRLIGRVIDSDTQFHCGYQTPRPAPILRLAVAFVCILLCALSRNAWFTLAVLSVELLRTAMKPPRVMAHILHPVAVALIFAAAFTAPAIFLGSPGSFGTITMKVCESVLVLSLMNEEVSWKETTGALSSLRLPGIVIFTLDTTVRFLVILGRFSNAMVEAVSLRSVGKRSWRTAGTGGILGSTFLKSQQMATATSEAMACRGFNGSYAPGRGRLRANSRRQHLIDGLYALLIPLLIAGFIYTQRLMTAG